MSVASAAVAMLCIHRTACYWMTPAHPILCYLPSCVLHFVRRKKTVRDVVSIIDIAGNNRYIESDSSALRTNNERNLGFLYGCGAEVRNSIQARKEPEKPQRFHNRSSALSFVVVLACSYHSLPLLFVGRQFLPLYDHYLWLHLGFSFPIHRYQMMMMTVAAATWSSLKRVQIHIINGTFPGKLFFQRRGG